MLIKNTIKTGVSIKDAMFLLDKTGSKILFLIDESGVLYGAVTDGDIRRWILHGGDLSEKIEKAANTNPLSFPVNSDKALLKQVILQKKISAIPLVDHDNKIVDIVFWENIVDKELHPEKPHYNKLDVPVVIMAGGKGTRLDPFTKILPKPLIPIGDKAIIEIIIDEFLNYQIDSFYLSVNHKARIIKSYFDELEPPYKIEYIYEKEPLGTAGSLKLLSGIFKSSFFVTNCDIVIKGDYGDIYKFHEMKDNDITLVASMKSYNIPYGVCEIENGGKLLKITEKPEFSFLVNTGMYVVKPEMLDFIPADTFFHITHLIDKVKDAGGKIGVYPITENSWIDTGEWVEYKKALAKLSM